MNFLGVKQAALYKCFVAMRQFENYHDFIEQIMNTDDFLLFKKMMVKKNKELERETLEYMETLGFNVGNIDLQ